jgi:hypothetical protein
MSYHYLNRVCKAEGMTCMKNPPVSVCHANLMAIHCLNLR